LAICSRGGEFFAELRVRSDACGIHVAAPARRLVCVALSGVACACSGETVIAAAPINIAAAPPPASYIVATGIIDSLDEARLTN
jgi:hypothetical protein